MTTEPPSEARFRLGLSGVQRKLVIQACTDLRDELLDGADEDALRRLYPTAHPDDPAQQQFFEQMTRGDLTDRRVAALTTVIDTAERDSIGEEEAQQWMQAINAVRLVLGTQLDVSEDDDLDELDPDDPATLDRMAYEFLGYLLASLVQTLRSVG